jgi:hypothetical protein
MKKATGTFFVFFLFVLALTVAGCGAKTAAPDAQPEPPPQRFSSEQFENPRICQYCHQEIYRQWSGSMHSRSATNPFYQEQAQKASRESAGAADIFCARCHVPIGVLAGEIPQTAGAALSEVAASGVSCDFCHTITEVTGTGNAAFRLTPGRTKYGPFVDPLHTPLHDSEFLKIYTESQFCGACHNITHPENGLVLSATYSEWKASPLAARGVQCQHCHMTPGPGVTRPNPGFAATGAPKKREHISTHYMAGSDVFALRQAGAAEHARLAEENSRAAAELFLGLPPSLRPYQPGSINVRVRNSGAGHYLPTGLSLFREMWLELVVRDEQGKVLFQSGVVSADGKIPAGSVTFGVAFADAAGRETTSLWLARGVLRDRRVPPQKYVDEKFEVPGLTRPGTLHVRARLLRRGVLVRMQENPKLKDFPVIEMAAVSGQVHVK